MELRRRAVIPAPLSVHFYSSNLEPNLDESKFKVSDEEIVRVKR
jgi:hypothetical protein